MKIVMETLEENQEHWCGYDTAGDWRFVDGNLHVTVSQMGKYSEIAVMIHELIEALLCEQAGITEQAVSDHDRMFEAERTFGKHTKTAEPGDDFRSPYRSQHQAATLVELLVLTLLGKPWPEHCDNIP